MNPQKTVTISFSLERLRLIEEALKKAERLFDYRQRTLLRCARRQINIRLGKIDEQQKRDEQKVDVERKLQG